MARFGRFVFWAGLVIIVGEYVLVQFAIGNVFMAILGLIFFPITYLVSPWFTGLWWLLLLSLAGYWVSTLGRMPPVE